MGAELINTDTQLSQFFNRDPISRTPEVRGMLDIMLATAAGILIGLSIGLVSFRLASRQQIKEAQETGMHKLYHEIVTKRKHHNYQYSDEARRVMETVHLSNILH